MNLKFYPDSKHPNNVMVYQDGGGFTGEYIGSFVMIRCKGVEDGCDVWITGTTIFANDVMVNAFPKSLYHASMEELYESLQEEWCKWCKELDEDVWPDEQIEAKLTRENRSTGQAEG